MLGLFKRMLSRSEAPQKAPPVRPASIARPSVPVLPKPRAAAPSPASAPVRGATVGPRPSPQPVAQAAPVQPSTPPPAAGAHVQVALATIAASLPEALQHKVPANPDQFVAVPIDWILPQLSQGQVLLTVAQLYECSPEFCGALAGHEEVVVALPLAGIVKQLSAEHFARRNQRRVDVPQEVAPIFTPNGQGATIATPAPAQPAPAYRAQPSVTTTSAQTPPPSAPAAKVSASAAALAAMKAATSSPPPSRPVTPAARPITPAPIPSASVPRLAAPSPAAKKTFPVAPKPAGELTVPLSAVCHDWVQEVRAQLVDVDVEQHQILAPLDILEPAMKSGKVLFSWQEVASWIQPPLPNPPTPKVGEMVVELPLKIIAPLFMAHHRGGAQKRIAVDESIPDLFNGGNGNSNGQGHDNGVGPVPSQVSTTPRAPFAAPARHVTPSAPSTPAPVRMVSTPLPKAEAQPAAEEVPLAQVIGNGTGHFGAKEIVANAAKLPGVAGALLVMSDGLLVTSNTPPSVKAETIAAFLPQMFGRMNQYTKELALGPLQQLTLGVEGGQWHVIKCPNIYFAALGKRGEPLPLNLLAQIAAELSSQSN